MKECAWRKLEKTRQKLLRTIGTHSAPTGPNCGICTVFLRMACIELKRSKFTRLRPPADGIEFVIDSDSDEIFVERRQIQSG